MSDTNPSPAGRTRNTALTCLAVAAGMLGLAYASVPLYNLFCTVTGFGGTPMLASGPASRVLDRTLTIRFDANVAPNLRWRFTPEAPAIKVKVGETQTIAYKIQNTGDAPATAMATYNVLPELAGGHFMKLECFCFQENTLKAGETMEAAVVFYIDPAIADDPGMADVHDITLSYTYFPSKNGKTMEASADQ
jgi:cytochrome c oxidase assembly protein subunit 11